MYCLPFQVVYSHTGKVGTETVSKKPVNTQQTAIQKEEDDFDIDAI